MQKYVTSGRTHYMEFLAGFADSTHLPEHEAEEQWAGFSRDLGDGERRKIEAGGEASGREEGAKFLKLYSQT